MILPQCIGGKFNTKLWKMVWVSLPVELLLVAIGDCRPDPTSSYLPHPATQDFHRQYPQRCVLITPLYFADALSPLGLLVLWFGRPQWQLLKHRSQLPGPLERSLEQRLPDVFQGDLSLPPLLWLCCLEV